MEEDVVVAHRPKKRSVLSREVVKFSTGILKRQESAAVTRVCANVLPEAAVQKQNKEVENSEPFRKQNIEYVSLRQYANDR